jgi:hypothetical protein
MYYEASQGPGGRTIMSEPTTIPVGYSYFPKEVLRFPLRYALIQIRHLLLANFFYFSFYFRWFRERNMVFQSQHDSGGHFAAHEKPQELVGDLRKMFGKDGPAYGVVSGKVGYA